MTKRVRQCEGFMAGWLLLNLALACSGRVASGDGASSAAGSTGFAGAGGSRVGMAGSTSAGSTSAGSTASPGGAGGDPEGGGAGSVATGGDSKSPGGTSNDAGMGNDDAGGESAVGDGGEGPVTAVRLLLLEPPAPPSTPAGLTPDDERSFSTSYCCASADASVIVGVSRYVFPRLSAQPSGELSRPFIWREETGLKELGPISDPDQGFVAAIEPDYVSADGSRVFGNYSVREVAPGGSEPVWSTRLGGFFVWTEAKGYTRLGPPGPVRSGWLAAVSTDGKTALGYVQTQSDISLGFLWTEAGGYSLIEDLPDWPSDLRSYSFTLSRDGSSIWGLAGDDGFRWRESKFQWLGNVGIWPICRPGASSADGAVIVGSCQNGNQPSITFRWTEASGMVALDADSSVQISPTEVSDRGDVVLGTEWGGPRRVQGLAFWESGAPMRQVAPSSDLAANFQIAPRGGMTADGSAAIGTRFSDNRQSGAFRWTRSGGVRDLPPLNVMEQTSALSQSKEGRLVAGSSGFSAVLWDDAGIRDIGAELRSAGVDQKEWLLSEARGVTESDSVIAYGNATRPGLNSDSPEQRAWIAWLRAR